MKNRAFLTTLMLLSLVLVFGLNVYAQSARDVQRDLEVSFSADYSGFDDPGRVFGKVTNKSPNAYSCVRLEFGLGTRYDHAGREPNRAGSAFVVEVHNVSPHSVQNYEKRLPLPSSVGLNSKSECSGQGNDQRVTLYDNPNFEGPSRSFGLGPHTLMSAADFNDRASSIKVPADLVVIVSEHADAGGGYGLWVDFLEDQPNLAAHNLDNKISHLKIIPRRDANSVWVRNRTQSGKFEAGHYEVVGRGGGGGGALNPTPLVAKKVANIRQPQDPRPEPSTSTPAVCTISGEVRKDKPGYATQITLYRNGSPTSFSMRVTGGQYKFTGVPEGTYEVRGKGTYPIFDSPRGPSTLKPFADSSQTVTCQRNGSYAVNFEIRNTEG